MSFERLYRVAWTWIAIAAPLVAIKLWVLLDVGYYSPPLFAGDALVAIAVCGLLVLFVRWRVAGMLSWPLALLVYAVLLLLQMAEAISYYFQASSFNGRFFANVRLENLQSGVDAFPGLTAIALLVLLGALAWTGWWLARQSRLRARDPSMPGAFKAIALLVLAAAVVAVPSAGHRLAKAVARGSGDASAAGSMIRPDTGLINPHAVPRDVVRAASGKNLVIIYMESLERIYTDNQIFPGLTPNLDHWRAQGLDYTDYLTFTGADYTIAGLFASQCGAPYLPSPVRALELGGNNANASGFQPELACLGDVLHAAGYRQVFMQGANLKFADKGSFFHLHGFDGILGLTQIENANGNALPQQGWGLYDSDLLRLAAERFDKLAASGKPFNLDVLTVDTHPKHGRPSPGCPAYAANRTSTLQAVHCTDFLVGRFLHAISGNPAWKNTIVVVMSDHQSMPNNAWPLYPKSYERRPLLFILNAGQGQRSMRFYHMDIAPTLLHLMGVRTNATFLAGADRSEVGAPGSPLVNDPADIALLRETLWARAQPLQLCKRGALVGGADNGVRIGDYTVPMSWRGRRRVGLRARGAWMVRVGTHSVHGRVFDEGSHLNAELANRTPNESLLLVSPLPGTDVRKRFSIDWIGRHGGRTHLADVPRLRDLQITSPRCTSLLDRMNALPVGQKLDLSTEFKASTAPLYPPLSFPVTFNMPSPNAPPFERELGWMEPEIWGSFAVGDYASMGFTLPRDHCHAMDLDFKVHPFIHASRPVLNVNVYANGKLMTTWRFGKKDTGETWHHVFAPVRTADPQCRVDLRFVFSRPGAAPPPWPENEDPRPLQLLFLNMQPRVAMEVAAH